MRRCAAKTAPSSAPTGVPDAAPASFTGSTPPSSIHAAISTPAKSTPANACKNGCRRNSAAAPLLRGGEDDCAAFAETNSPMAFFLRKAAKNNFVTVLDKSACFTRRQCQRFAAARGQFEQATPAILLWSGYCSRTNQVANFQIAAVARVMSHHLRHGPIHGSKAGLGQPKRASAGAPHGLRRQIGFQRDVEPAFRTIGRVVEMR